MNLRRQRNRLKSATYKNGPSAWEFLWQENGSYRKLLCCTTVIDTFEPLVLALKVCPKKTCSEAT
jgi:hypothetical protein